MALSRLQTSTISSFCILSFRLVLSACVHTSFDLSIIVLFSWAKKYQHIPSSKFFRTKPNARWTFAAYFSSLNTKSSLSLSKDMSKDDTAILKTLCLPFSISVSVKKCLQDSNSSLKLWSSTSPTMSSTSILLAPNPICVPYCVILCWRKAWNPGNSAWQNLHLYVTVVLDHCVFWHYDIINHLLI